MLADTVQDRKQDGMKDYVARVHWDIWKGPCQPVSWSFIFTERGTCRVVDGHLTSKIPIRAEELLANICLIGRQSAKPGRTGWSGWQNAAGGFRQKIRIPALLAQMHFSTIFSSWSILLISLGCGYRYYHDNDNGIVNDLEAFVKTHNGK